MRLDVRVRRAVLVLVWVFGCVSCTFPSVDYETSCSAPASCESGATSCSNKAAAEQNKCSMKCTMSCVECETTFEQALSGCVTQCEGCSAKAGCLDATESCKALLGVP